MPAELRPRELLDELLECANAPRQRDEGVRLHEHQVLALMHVVDHDQLLGFGEHVLALAQEVWDDAGDVAAMAKRGMSNLAHQPEAAPAIDEADAVLCQYASEVARSLGKGGIAARARAAIDADIPDARGER